jgi:hypothetical protein
MYAKQYYIFNTPLLQEVPGLDSGICYSVLVAYFDAINLFCPGVSAFAPGLTIAASVGLIDRIDGLFVIIHPPAPFADIGRDIAGRRCILSALSGGMFFIMIDGAAWGVNY